MKGIRFYHENKQPTYLGFGSVFALSLENYPHYIEGFSGVQNFPNNPVNWGSASREYLASCKRVSEFKARRIHPSLFNRLDDVNDDDFNSKERCKMRFWTFLCNEYYLYTEYPSMSESDTSKILAMERIAKFSKSVGITITFGAKVKLDVEREEQKEIFNQIINRFEEDQWTIKDFI